MYRMIRTAEPGRKLIRAGVLESDIKLVKDLFEGLRLELV